MSDIDAREFYLDFDVSESDLTYDFEKKNDEEECGGDDGGLQEHDRGKASYCGRESCFKCSVNILHG